MVDREWERRVEDGWRDGRRDDGCGGVCECLKEAQVSEYRQVPVDHKLVNFAVYSCARSLAH